MKHFFFVILAVICSCKSPRAKYETAAKANALKISEFSKLANQAPEISTSQTAALAALADFSVKYKHSNAMLVQIEELENPTVRLALPLRVNQRSPVADIAHALNFVRPVAENLLETSYDYSCGEESPDWRTVAELKYLLVARPLKLKEAQLTGEKTFESGRWNGEVLVFDFNNKRLLGGFPLTGGNHAFVKTELGRDQENLNADLHLAVRGNFNADLRKHIPAVTFSDEIN